MLQASPRMLSCLAAVPYGAGEKPESRLQVQQRLLLHCFADMNALATTCLVLLDPDVRPEEAAAFACSTARPAVLLPWLRALAQALLALPMGFEPSRHGEPAVHPLYANRLCAHRGHLKHCNHLRSLSAALAELHCQALMLFATLVAKLAEEPVWCQHAQAIQADPALQCDIADVLLSRCLPAVAQQAQAMAPCQHREELQRIESWASKLEAVLTGSIVRQAAILHLSQGSAAVAAATTAGCFLQALPRAASAAGDAEILVAAWSGSLHLVGRILQLSRQPSPVGSAGNAGSATRSAERELAACTVVREVPAAVAALLAAAGNRAVQGGSDNAHSSWHIRLACFCCNLTAALLEAGEPGRQPATDEARTLWLRAAATGMRLHPALLQLHSSLCPLAEPDLQSAAQQITVLLTSLVDVAVAGLPSVERQTASGLMAADPSASADLAAALALLHTQLCRLIHWLAGGGDALILMRRPDFLAWLMLMASKVLLAWAHLRPTTAG